MKKRQIIQTSLHVLKQLNPPRVGIQQWPPDVNSQGNDPFAVE